jgi:hypothetical protein
MLLGQTNSTIFGKKYASKPHRRTGGLKPPMRRERKNLSRRSPLSLSEALGSCLGVHIDCGVSQQRYTNDKRRYHSFPVAGFAKLSFEQCESKGDQEVSVLPMIIEVLICHCTLSVLQLQGERHE